MSGKSDKIQTHKKKTEKKSGESRKYAQISCDSIIAAAEANGISAVSEDISKQLAEDVSYRLREVIHNCSVHLRQNKRRRLLTADVKAVFQTSDVPPVYGHLNDEPLGLLHVREAGVFVPEEQDIDLAAFALNHDPLTQKSEPFVKGSWLYPDGTTDGGGNPQPIKTEDVKPATSNPEKPNNSPQIPSHLLSYYSHISKIILGNSEILFKMVLRDLQSNSKIGPIAPYLLNLLALGLQKLPKGTTFSRFRHRFLCTAEALTFNTLIEPSATISVHRVISTLLLCVLDATLIEGASAKCNYELRNIAAHVLVKVVNRWCGKDTKLRLDVMQKLGSVLLDGSSSLRNHYSALQTLCALGYDALDYCVWPHLEQYLAFLDIMKAQQDIKRTKRSLPVASWFHQSSDVMEIEGALLNAVEMLYQKDWNNSPDQSPTSFNIRTLEKTLEAYFGDTLCARRPYYCNANTKREGAGTNISNGGMEVDMLVSSVMKDSSNTDFELDYRNWTAIAKIPVHVPPLFVNRNPSSSIEKRLNMHSGTRISSAFDIPKRPEHYSSTIQFNFAGANPMSKRRLKRRLPDPKQIQLVCPSVYFRKSCQLGCIGKLVRRQHKFTSRSWSADIMTTL
ncbi:TAF6-like RNA polymerase II p300/CBP-associated factor-associated factor 65 kDa subunit 6L [Periplaneta americana]|uniref:TAF6-like RNA polymerase II p300/CBP-associated factor-associated factor 65 kDa subunit 6L n=1 Tax=Periplaneta americana TaxID=6978 RepID=UPI0037E9C3DF